MACHIGIFPRNRKAGAALRISEGDYRWPRSNSFTITKSPDDVYTITIEDDDGQTLEFEATYEQLDLIQESLEEHLEDDVEDHELADDDDDVDEVDEL